MFTVSEVRNKVFSIFPVQFHKVLKSKSGFKSLAAPHRVPRWMEIEKVGKKRGVHHGQENTRYASSNHDFSDWVD